MYIDLQLHSTYSDGYLSPTDLVELLHDKGIKVAALTDHNTVSGLHEFRHACRRYKIKSIIGIELYAKISDKKFNVLWYNFNDDEPELHDMLRATQVRRRKKTRQILKGLKKNGFDLDVNKILDKYTHYVPINHVVDDVTENKENMKKIIKELKIKLPREEHIIEKYFRDPKIGKLEPSYIDFKRIVAMREKVGGQLILCHPAKHNYIQINFLKKLKKLGIDGVELLSPHHSYNAIMFLQQLAREFDFIETGGSDFHRYEGHNHLLQHAWQYFKIEEKHLRGVKKIIG